MYFYNKFKLSHYIYWIIIIIIIFKYNKERGSKYFFGAKINNGSFFLIQENKVVENILLAKQINNKFNKNKNKNYNKKSSEDHLKDFDLN